MASSSLYLFKNISTLIWLLILYFVLFHNLYRHIHYLIHLGKSKEIHGFFYVLQELTKIENETLLVRHLPTCFTEEDCSDFFKQIGAIKTKYMGHKGSLKHAAFVTFQSAKEASNILSKLHQLSFLGTTLVVEYSKPHLERDFISSDDQATILKSHPVNGDHQVQQPSNEDEEHQMKLKSIQNLNCISSAWNFEYGFKNDLYYSYPPPSLSILTNIKNALASVPKFYIQVLHLMNKMNLPAPFGPVTFTPPIYDDTIQKEDHILKNKSESESEIESDEEEKRKRVPLKRKAANEDITKEESMKKRFKSQIAMKVQLESLPKSSVVHSNPDEIFERNEVTVKPIKFDIKPTLIPDNQNNHETSVEPALVEEQDVGGFGKIVPEEKKLIQDNPIGSNTEWSIQEFMSKVEMAKNRMPFEEIKSTSAFKNYEAGKKTSRIYIKNLHKSVTENDLHFIFGNYVNWDNEEKHKYDIRLIKVKYVYAFVTLPSEDLAERAVRETNGLILKGKPMAVQFANSAK